MHRRSIRRRSIRLTLVAAGAALVLAACGSSSKTGTPASSGSPSTASSRYGNTTAAAEATTTAATAAATTAAAPSSGPAAVTLADNTKIGKKILVDAKGRTLYVYDNDTAGKSACNGVCAQAWPPVAPAAGATYGNGLTASMFSTITRDDGTTQLAVNGKPLYLWQGDTAPGDATGQGVNHFYVVGADGTKIDES
jgi:predicted lipoprotein with Yx(FWY)xxD motif